MSKISVVLPTYNERENIKNMIEYILKNVKNQIEIIVVDDNSPDRTWETAKRLNKKNVRVIRRINERGLASAIARGIKESKGDIVVWMDADLGMPPSVIPCLIKALDDSDIAVGSRYIKGGKDNRSLSRVITSRLINLYANFILGFGVKDYSSGFVAVKKHVFDTVKLSTKGYGSYCIDFLYKAKRKGFKIKEIPYTFSDRKRGVSKSSEHFYSLPRYGLQYGLRILKIRFE